MYETSFHANMKGRAKVNAYNYKEITGPQKKFRSQGHGEIKLKDNLSF